MAMTVRELIEALSQIDSELPVIAEGCDCTNPVVRISVQPTASFFGHVTPAHCFLAVEEAS